MAAIVALLLCTLAVFVQARTPELPVFQDTYSVKADLTTPDIVKPIPLQLYYSGEKNASRVDYFGMFETYQFPADGKHGVEFVVLPEENNLCYRIDGTAAEPVTLRGTLPTLSSFLFKGSELIDKVFAEKWEQTKTAPGILYSEKHTMHVRNKGRSQGAKPVRYSVRRVNRLYFVDPDEHILNFYDYNSLDLDSNDVFQLRINPEECRLAKREKVHNKIKDKHAVMGLMDSMKDITITKVVVTKPPKNAGDKQGAEQEQQQ